MIKWRARSDGFVKKVVRGGSWNVQGSSSKVPTIFTCSHVYMHGHTKWLKTAKTLNVCAIDNTFFAWPCISISNKSQSLHGSSCIVTRSCMYSSRKLAWRVMRMDPETKKTTIPRKPQPNDARLWIQSLMLCGIVRFVLKNETIMMDINFSPNSSPRH